MADDSRSSMAQASGLVVAELSEQQLWLRWHELGDEAAREQLIHHYQAFARMHAALCYRGRFHDDVEFADYEQLACVGLIEAVNGFKPRLGVQFKTFAAHRVRGAILDGLEKLSERNQQINLRQRLRRQRLEDCKVGAAQGQEPLSDAALLRYLEEVGVGLALGLLLEGTGMFAKEDASACDPAPEILYFRKSELQQLRASLTMLIDHLPHQERQVLRYHYLQEVPFEGIARMMDLSRSRVSQIHRKALAHLRDRLVDRLPPDLAL